METLKLTRPVAKGDREISELVFADPKVKHLLAVDKYDPDSNAAALALAAALTGEMEILLGELPPEDWVKVRTISMNAYYRFMGLDWEAAVVQTALASGKLKLKLQAEEAEADPPKATESGKS